MENYEKSKEINVFGTCFIYDVSAGTTPDLYYISQSFGDMPINQCIAKGMFEDLTPYMEKDAEISSDGIFRLTSGVAMSTQCENKEAAWDFVRYLFTEEGQSKTYVASNGIPTRKDVFDVYVDEFTWDKSGKDKYGNDINTYKAFVDSCGGYYGCDRNIWNIISEEAASYFSGDKSLDDVSALIQDRVSTYVNENK